MRRIHLMLAMILASAALLAVNPGAVPAADTDHKPAMIKVKIHDPVAKKDVEKVFDPASKEHQQELVRAWMAGELTEIELDHPPSPLEPAADLGIWTIVVFILLLIVLRKMAWGPMLEGLKKREESILGAVEEAKRAREETQRVSAEFKVKMDQAYAEIPKIMEDARRDAEAFKEETRAQTAKDMQAERQRLRREIDTAKDQALQELWTHTAQLATLISAKVIGRSLPLEDHHRLIEEAMGELRKAAPRR